MPLNDRQARFVAEYLVDLNATQAAIRAGYSTRTANEQAARLLANVRANRNLVGTVIAAVAEVGPGILGGDAVERRAERPVQGVDVASRHAAQLALHLRPGRLDRAQVGRVGG